MKMLAQSVSRDNVLSVWPFCAALVDDAVERAHGEMTTGDVLDMLLTETMRLWVVLDNREIVAAATTEVVQYPQLKSLRVVTLGGKGLKAWFPELEAAWQAYSRREGCTRIEAAGRKGWGRALSDNGYAPGQSYVWKDLEQPHG